MPIPMSEWEWFGYPGHLVVAYSCRFKLCTKVGDFLVSTVGDYRSPGTETVMTTLGAGRDSFFETYVFRAGARCQSPTCGCGQPELEDACEIEGIRTATAKAAQDAHMAMCQKYAAETGVA